MIDPWTLLGWMGCLLIGAWLLFGLVVPLMMFIGSIIIDCIAKSKTYIVNSYLSFKDRKIQPEEGQIWTFPYKGSYPYDMTIQDVLKNGNVIFIYQNPFPFHKGWQETPEEWKKFRKQDKRWLKK